MDIAEARDSQCSRAQSALPGTLISPPVILGRNCIFLNWKSIYPYHHGFFPKYILLPKESLRVKTNSRVMSEK